MGLFLISLIAMFFIPMVSFSFKNIVSSKEFTRTLFADQEYVENEMETWQGLEPTDPNTTDTIEVFGVDIKGHKIELATPTSGDVNIFLPQREIVEDIPVIKAPPILIVKENNSNVSPQPNELSLNSTTRTLFVNEVEITDATKPYFLMNVYRWYLAQESGINFTPTNNTSDYTILKEWNEARPPVSLADSLSLNFIPNIKIGYNTIDFIILQTDLGFSNEEMINRFGNRFIQYGVTPFSEAGRIGAEELSNPIYIKAPRIKIKSAEFIGENKLGIEFEDNVLDVLNLDLFELNPLLGNIKTVVRDDTNKNIVLVEYENTVDQSSEMAGNFLRRGAVKDENYGAISIWHNEILEGEFTIEDD